jgi:hypothetical protein
MRNYYAGVPDAVQIGEHQYIERKVAELFVNLMLISWYVYAQCSSTVWLRLYYRTSATNCARIYNESLGIHGNININHNLHSQAKFILRTEQVWDSFVILSLLQDCVQRETLLCVPHTGDQETRFKAAMEQRNERIVVYGQPEWAHACFRCMKRSQDSDGNIRASFSN